MGQLPDPDRANTPSEDEALADDARRRLRAHGIVAIEPDDRIGVMLAPGERLVSVRRAVALERRSGDRVRGAGLQADLYVTTSRLVCLGAVPVEVPLGAIREAVVAPGTLLLDIGRGRGLEVRTGDPKLLRVEIAAVREAAREAAPGPPSRAAASGPVDQQEES